MEELKNFRTIGCKYKKAPEVFCAKYSHISSADMKKIYDPGEDTFLLIDSLFADLHTISDANPFTCMEFGPGSGVVRLSV